MARRQYRSRVDRPAVTSVQVQSLDDRVQINGMPAVAEGAAPVKVHVTPATGDVKVTSASAFSFPPASTWSAAKTDRSVVERDRVRDQPRALVADLDLKVGSLGEFLLTTDLRDGGAQ